MTGERDWAAAILYWPDLELSVQSPAENDNARREELTRLYLSSMTL